MVQGEGRTNRSSAALEIYVPKLHHPQRELLTSGRMFWIRSIEPDLHQIIITQH